MLPGFLGLDGGFVCEILEDGGLAGVVAVACDMGASLAEAVPRMLLALSIKPHESMSSSRLPPPAAGDERLVKPIDKDEKWPLCATGPIESDWRAGTVMDCGMCEKLENAVAADAGGCLVVWSTTKSLKGTTLLLERTVGMTELSGGACRTEVLLTTSTRKDRE